MMCSACDISDSSIHIFTIVSIAKNALGLECRPFPPLAVYVHDRKLMGAFFQTVKWQLQIAYWPAIKIFTKELRQVENIFVKKKDK